jgi:fluoride exporter
MIHFIAFWLVGLGGIIGTLCRFYLGRWVVIKTGTSFPWGTWVINLTGSLILGMLFALHNREALTDEIWWLLGVGFCGAYTTFSTFGYEVQQLIEKKHVIAAAIYMLSSIGLGLLVAWCGMVIST